MLDIRPTTIEDVQALVAEPLPWRIKAMTAFEDGKPIALGGLVYIPDGTVAAFLIGGEHAKRFPLSFHKAVLAGLREARRSGIRRIAAMAACDVEPAERWLLRLGFAPVEIDGERVFVWQ